MGHHQPEQYTNYRNSRKRRQRKKGEENLFAEIVTQETSYIWGRK